jgi:hypothetical protein
MLDPMLFPALLSLSFGGIIGIISQIQHSRCEEIRCCGCYCKRKVPTEQEQLNNNETIARIVENQE